MILEDREEHRGYDVIFTSIITRRNTVHGKLKGSHKMKKSAPGATEGVWRALPER